jgi:hypothetical protein
MAAEAYMTDGIDIGGGLEDLAARWLDAETRAHGEPANTAIADEAARLGEAYEDAVGQVTQEELRIAWEGAVRRQGEQEIGGPAWAEARRVSELLRAEYLARNT